MKATISPRSLAGTVRAPASKSYAQRYLIASLLSGSEIPVFKDAGDDVAATSRAVQALRRGETVVDCASSGTAARILMQILPIAYPDAEIVVSEQLSKRPLEQYVAQPARAGIYTLAGDTSSQYISGLLFALPLLDGDSRIELTCPLESAGYVDMTIDVLAQFGIDIIDDGARGWTVPGNQVYVMPERFTCEGDWSSAPVWLVAGVAVRGLQEDTLQPDGRAFLRYCTFVDGVATIDPAREPEAHVDVSQCPDLTPLLAVMAALKKGSTTITGTRRLRIKESDRITSVAALIAALGGRVAISHDDIIIEGTGSLRGGTVDAFDDHRIVMAAALASCFCREAVTISGADAVTKSYERFFEDFIERGGCVEFE